MSSARWLVAAWIASSSLGPAVAVEPLGTESGAEKARAVLKTYCYRCHGQDGRNEGGLNVVTDLGKLVESKRVIPGEPGRSKLLKRTTGGDMPPEFDFEDESEEPPPLPRPTAAEVAVLRDWIQAGAIDPAPKARPIRFVSELDLLKAIDADLQEVAPRERRFVRYFTLTHLANAGFNEDQLETYRVGLSKLINSLSWSRRVRTPEPIDAGRTILRIDLRDYLWDEEVWGSILGHYPYGIVLDGRTAAAVEEAIGCELPYVRADWFVYSASRPPLYHEALRLPETVEELERKLDVDVEANIRQDRVARAAFNASGVSRNNRLIERHESTNGGYWRSYDFAGSADRKNLFSHPLGPGIGDYEFDYDGGEVIFALPNGLNGYMLIDSEGRRIDKGPTEIVRDNKQSDGAVVNGVSCMSCHNRGLIEKADQVRDLVLTTKAFPREVAETVEALYVPRDRLDDLLEEDLERFAKAVKQTGASISQTEPVFALATQFEGDLNADLAAAEAGVEPAGFRELLGEAPELGQALGLLLVGGTVKRDAFVAAFPKIAEARHLSMLDPVGAPPEFDPPPASRPIAARPFLVPDPRGPSGPGSPFGNFPGFPSGAPPGFPRRGEPPPYAKVGRKAYPTEKVADLPDAFFGERNDRFREVGPEGGVLVGLKVSYKVWMGGPKIGSVQGLYRAGTKVVEGQRYGTLSGPEVAAVAKPGYAIGAFRTHAGLGLDGFEIIFMKVKGNRLDPADAYLSPWLGDPRGGGPQFVANPEGRFPVGLQGRAEGSIRALGLVILK